MNRDSSSSIDSKHSVVRFEDDPCTLFIDGVQEITEEDFKNTWYRDQDFQKEKKMLKMMQRTDNRMLSKLGMETAERSQEHDRVIAEGRKSVLNCMLDAYEDVSKESHQRACERAVRVHEDLCRSRRR